MPAVRLFDTLRQKVEKSGAVLPYEKRAMYFFQNYTTDLIRWQKQHSDITYGALSKNNTYTKKIVSPKLSLPGSLYFFLYDPKGAKILPYYDQFPFVLVLKRDQGSLLGLNFHYLNYRLRAMFFDLLYVFRDRDPLASTSKVNQVDHDLAVRLRVTYDILSYTKKYRAFRPCIKRYLFSHFRTPLIQVGANEWPIALFLPVESFVGAPISTIWDDSEKMI